ncbi:reverse transcriptase domain-containing protein [Paenibacillus albidus]|uniref:reverse transcriptase domain-containing protein n=1 Tax=Paenibacillus albidus TaxID=2041023 RepID=UPI00203604D1|nr:reverse transcriptase domain-containing protein [Paenibacillus albidus]
MTPAATGSGPIRSSFDRIQPLWIGFGRRSLKKLGELISYADDFVIMCRTKQQALESIKVIQSIMGKLDLSINRNKSRLINLWNDIDGFDFLGFHNRKFPIRRKGRNTLYIMSHIPKKNAMKKMRAKIKAYTKPRNKLFLDIKELVKGLNRKLQGFKNYYLLSTHAKKWLKRIDWYVLERLTLFYNKKKNNRKKHGNLKHVRKEIEHILVKLVS